MRGPDESLDSVPDMSDVPQETPPKGRLRPSHIALLLGLGWAILTALAGIAATITQFHDDSPISRRDFINVPAPVKGVFYVLLTFMFLAVGYLFAQRVQNWERGKPDNRRTTTKNAKRPRRVIPLGRVDADAAPRRRGGAHAQPHLLPVPDPLRGHDRADHQRAAPAGDQVPARHRVPGLRGRGRRRRRPVPRRHRLGRLPPLRPARLPGAHQEPARGPHDPRHVRC